MNYTKENWKTEPTAQELKIYRKVKAHIDMNRLNDLVYDEYDITLNDIDDETIAEILEEYDDRMQSYDDELLMASKGHGLRNVHIHTWMDDLVADVKGSLNEIVNTIKK